MFLSTCISSTTIGLNNFKPQYYCSYMKNILKCNKTETISQGGREGGRRYMCKSLPSTEWYVSQGWGEDSRLRWTLFWTSFPQNFPSVKKNSSINNLIILSYMVFENNKKSLILNEKRSILSQIKLSICLRSLYCSFLRHMW